MSTSRTLAAAALLALFLPSGDGLAQEVSAQAWEELWELQNEILEDRDAIVRENLPLTPEEAQYFWPVYAEYREAKEALALRTVELIAAYAANVDSMSDAKADAFFEEWLAIEAEDLKLREHYAVKVREVLPGLKAIRFFQVESKLDAIMELGITLRVPLVE